MEVFLGSILLVAFNFAPQGWAFCNGQLLSIAQNSALFSLLGTYYGGDGVTSFALPDLRSRVPIHIGQGNGLSQYSIGQTGGYEAVTLSVNHIPAHTHAITINANSNNGDYHVPTNYILSRSGAGDTEKGFTDQPANVTLSPNAATAASTGGGGSHTNLQPYLAMNYIIALQGIFPSQS